MTLVTLSDFNLENFNALLKNDGVARAGPLVESGAASGIGKSHFPAKAKSVIWIFLSGGYSHMETFDPKPALNKYAGKTFADTPYPNPADHPLLLERPVDVCFVL